MFDNPKMYLAVLLAAVPLSADADSYSDDYGWLGGGSWYGSVRAGFLPAISSDGQFFGPTESVYGGSPLIEMDDGFQYSLAVGREIFDDVFDDLRLEFELSYLTSQIDTSPVPGASPRDDDVFALQGDVDSLLFMVNLGYDFNNLRWWATPYLRGGVGVAETDVSASQSVDFDSAIWQGTAFEGRTIDDEPFSEGSTSEFAWSFAAGFKKEIADRWAVRLEYSFLNRGEGQTGINVDGDAVRFSDLESQQITLGLDWQF